MNNKNLVEAKSYAKRGWYVLPIHSIGSRKECTCNNIKCSCAGKHPRTKNGLKDATVKEEFIDQFWKKWPNANIGIATGEISGIIVLDIDPRNGGNESLKKIISPQQTLQNTLSVTTGGGGNHFFFKYNNAFSKSKNNLLPGIDIKSNGGYVVAAPSIHASGNTYKWVNYETEIQEMPEWLIESLKDNYTGTKEIIPDIIKNKISEGSRNNYLTSLAGLMFSKGMSIKAVLDGLKTENIEQCNPPLYEKEVFSIVSSISKHRKDINIETKDETFEIITLRDLMNKAEATEEWLVEGLLPKVGTSTIVAKPKVGKSTLARNLVMAIAKGNDFLRRKTIPGKVLYFALEDSASDIKKHFLELGATGNELISLAIGNVPKTALNQLRNIVACQDINLVVIDTTFRMINVNDCNQYAEVTKALSPIINIARECNTHICCVHHARKGSVGDGDSILGSQAFFGTFDTILLMEKGEKYRTIKSIQRQGNDLDETVLDFDKESRSISAAESKVLVDMKYIQNEILKYLNDSGGLLLEKEIHDGIEGRKQQKVKAIRELLKSKQIQRIGKGGKRDPYKYHVPTMKTQSGTNKIKRNNFLGSVGLTKERNKKAF